VGELFGGLTLQHSSVCLYFRRLFPDTAFKEVTFGGEIKGGVKMNLIAPELEDDEGNTLTDDDGNVLRNEEAQQLDDWLKYGKLELLACIPQLISLPFSGVNDAIQKKYLRAVLFSIHGHEDRSELAEEHQDGAQEDDHEEIGSLVEQYQVSSPQVHTLIQFYTNTDYFLVTLCSWNLPTSSIFSTLTLTPTV
jgi:hypothetical protein